MPIPDHSHRKSLTQYLDKELSGWRYYHEVSDDIKKHLEKWWANISTYLNDAANEYPNGHPDKNIYTQTKTKLGVCYNNIMKFPKILKDLPPGSVVTQIDGVYNSTGLANVTQLPAAPPNYTRVWVGTNPNFNCFFVNTKIRLSSDDIKNLYAAMIQDPNDGTTTDVGGSLRHKTTKSSGNISKMIWYTHKQNRLIAVSQCNPKNKTITVLTDGKVNAGNHNFN